MSGALRASVLVATHRRAAALHSTLESLTANHSVDLLHEVLILENGVRAGSEDVARKFAQILPIQYQFVEEANKSAALNVGLASCDAEFIIFFDDDIRIAKKTIRTYLDAADRLGLGHFFGGPITPLYETNPPADWLLEVLPSCTRGFDLGEAECFSHEFLGANWAAFKSDIQEVGGFSPGLGPNSTLPLIGEETELQARLVARGMKGCYLPLARVEHSVPSANCTIGWARRRRTRQHLSRTLARNECFVGPTIGGVPRFMWRVIATEGGRVLLNRLFRPHSQRRASAEMRLAEILGQAKGQRLLSQGVRIELA